MTNTAIKPMDAEEFPTWSSRQEIRYALVDGLGLALMTGASGLHDLIVTNSIAALQAQLRGSPCRLTLAEIYDGTGFGMEVAP